MTDAVQRQGSTVSMGTGKNIYSKLEKEVSESRRIHICGSYMVVICRWSFLQVVLQQVRL